MAEIKQRDLFVRRWSIYRVRIWRNDFEVDFDLGFTSRPMHVTESKTVLDSGFHAVGFRIPVLDSSFFFIGTWISFSNRLWDSRFLELESGFQNSGLRIPQAKFPWLWILQAKLSSPTWGDSHTHHAFNVKALCITAHCYTCSSDTDATYVAVVDYESTWLYKLIKWSEYQREGI